MTRLTIEATIAGTRPIEAYGGVELDRQVLVDMAERLRAGEVPMIIQHDPARPLEVTILDVGIAPDGDGYERLWMRFEVDAAAWVAVDAEWKEKGAPGGFSWSGSQPIDFLAGNSDPSKPTVHLAADASYWPDEPILAAATALSHHANVHPARRYAFMHIPDPVVVTTLWQVGEATFGAALWDALKALIRHRKAEPAESRARPTIFEFRVKRGDAEVLGRVETDDEAVLHRAIRSLEQLSQSHPAAATWDHGRASWVSGPSLPPAPSDSPPATADS